MVLSEYSNVFLRCADIILREEGGLSDRPLHEDPGKRTNLGITEGTLRRYHDVFDVVDPYMPDTVDELTAGDALRIYWKLYWQPAQCEHLPDWLALLVFDGVVMTNPAKIAKLLQKAVGSAQDGKIGPRTIDAANVSNPWKVIPLFQGGRLFYYAGLANMQSNPGWFARGIRLAMTAVEWARPASTEVA